MKPWHIALIAVAVIAAHGLLFWLISGTSALPKTAYIPPPNFVAKEAKFTDKESGNKMVYHEYRVTTHLALPDVVMEKKDNPQ